MKDKKMLGDFIYELRKAKGLSQSELGDLVGVSNKAVSKWETNESNPELSSIPVIAKILGVSTDELLSCKKNEAAYENGQKNPEEEESSFSPFLFRFGKYEYISKKRTKNGTPYVHINFKNFNAKAKGIIAIGPIASGVLSIGFIAKGVFALGLLTFGLFAFGAVGIGLLLSLGAIALGFGVSAGGVAAGILAVGGVAIGFMSVGGLSIGYYAYTGTGGLAIGVKTIILQNNNSLELIYNSILPVLKPQFIY